MPKKILVLCLLIVGSFTAAPAALAGDSEFVYVESGIQTPNGNSVFAFERHADGTLTQIPGSPFLTGGAGVQETHLVFGPYEGDSSLVADSSRKLLFAVNSGSDSIAVFHINSNGSLRPV